VKIAVTSRFWSVGLLFLSMAPSAASPAQAAVFHRPIVTVGANKSNNWSGYNQGMLEKGGKQFHSVDGTWVVPAATQHKAAEAEYSASWVGIGGGCVDANCTVTDATLIQAGMSQDVDATGHASYSACWETPVVIDNSGKVSVGPMPNLSTVDFDLSLANGAPAGLTAAEEVQLIDSTGAALATPSAPDADTDGFNVCTCASLCGVPAS